MVEYYFDVETTGIEPKNDKLITIQRQELSFGKASKPIEILKEWETSEKDIIKTYLSMAYCSNVWDFVCIGTNLLFDFHFINERAKKHGLHGTDLSFCRERPHIDLKHILVMLNKGRFKGYTDILENKTGILNEDIPRLYQNKEYKQIIRYITAEASTTIDFYGKMLELMPTLKRKN